MNARQKAKKYKKEFQRVQYIIDHKLHPVNVVRTNFHPERIKYKCPVSNFISDDIVKDVIAQYFGKYLMDNGFIEVNLGNNRPAFDEMLRNNIINYRIVEAYMVAIRPQEYTLGNYDLG